MSSQPEQFATHQIPNHKIQAKNLSSWTKADMTLATILLLGITAGVIWASQYSSAMAFLVAMSSLLMSVILLARPPAGYDRLYRSLSSGLDGALRLQTIQKGVIWQADDTSSRFVRFMRYGTLKPVDASAVWPLKPVLVEAEIEGELVRYGLARQKDRPFDHLVVWGSGANFVNENPNQQTRVVNELASILNRVAAESSLKIGLSLGRITGPADMSDIETYLAEGMDPTIAHPDMFVLDESQKAVTEFLGDMAASLLPNLERHGAATNWVVLVVTIKRDSKSKRASRGQLTDRQIFNLPVIKLGRSLCSALSSSVVLGMTDARCLELSELTSLLRSGWDVTNIKQYHADKRAGLVPQNDEQLIEQLTNTTAPFGDITQAWPQQQISVHRGEEIPWCLCMDDNHIATIRVNRLPQQEAHASQFLALHYEVPSGVWTRMSEIGQSVSGEMESKTLLYQRSLLANVEGAMNSRRIYEDPSKKRRRQHMSQANDMISAHSVAQHYHKLCCVVAKSHEELEDAVQKLRAAYLAHGFNTDLVPEPQRQFDAFLTATYMTSRM